MKRILTIALAVASIASAPWVFAAQEQDHQAHHPASAPAAKAAKAKPAAKPSPADMAKMDAQMKAMGEMHEKMMSAKTPEERQALMAEHMKAMHEGMSMMGQMKGAGGMAMSPEMMGKRMDMMEMMMQMMMDREAARSPAGK